MVSNCANVLGSLCSSHVRRSAYNEKRPTPSCCNCRCYPNAVRIALTLLQKRRPATLHVLMLLQPHSP